PVLPSRKRSLAILYQQLGLIYQQKQNYAAAIYTYEELGHLGDEEDRRARLMIMSAYRDARDLPKALQAGKDALAKYPSDNAIKTRDALLIGENGQVDEAVKLLKSQMSAEGDRETYLNVAQVYERAKRYKDAEATLHAAEILPGQPHDN